MLTTDERNVGGFFVMLGCFAIFVGFGVSTWIERKRSRNPALEVTELGLVFWRGSWRETTLLWDGLEKVWESGGSDSHIIFQPKDLKKYERRTFLVLRAGPSVPVKTAAEDGTRLAAIIQQIWEQPPVPPWHFEPITRKDKQADLMVIVMVTVEILSRKYLEIGDLLAERAVMCEPVSVWGESLFWRKFPVIAGIALVLRAITDAPPAS